MKGRTIMAKRLGRWVTAAVVIGIFFTTGASSIQARQGGVFTEIAGTEPVPAGYADLVVKASYKTHLEGYYLLEGKDVPHGTATYPYVVIIDGQSARWQVAGVKDDKPKYNPDGTTSRDPEAGQGMKYALEKRLRLKPGTHTVVLELPAEKFSRTLSVNLKDGETSVLEYKPLYRSKTLPTRMPSFLKELDGFDAFLNGKAL